MIMHPAANEQVVAAVFGSVFGIPTLDEGGTIVSNCSPYAAAFSAALEFLRGISGSESFFELWDEGGSLGLSFWLLIPLTNLMMCRILSHVSTQHC